MRLGALLILALLVIGVVLICLGWREEIGAAIKQRKWPVLTLLKGSLAQMALKGAALTTMAALLASPFFLLHHETKRADAAIVQVGIERQNTQIANAGLHQAELQIVRADAVNAARSETTALADAGAAELEAMGHAQIPTGDRASQLVRELRERAASEHADAVARYRERNPDRSDAAPGSTENRRGT